MRDIVAAVRTVWPDELPLLMRISATDWVNGGWDFDQTVELVRQLGSLGVDLIDCSSGGLSPPRTLARPIFAGGAAKRPGVPSEGHEIGTATAAASR